MSGVSGVRGVPLEGPKADSQPRPGRGRFPEALQSGRAGKTTQKPQRRRAETPLQPSVVSCAPPLHERAFGGRSNRSTEDSSEFLAGSWAEQVSHLLHFLTDQV